MPPAQCLAAPVSGALGGLMGNPSSDKSVRVMQVMPKMKKIIVADLQNVYDGR
jgi:hypothetical protein